MKKVLGYWYESISDGEILHICNVYFSYPASFACKMTFPWFQVSKTANIAEIVPKELVSRQCHDVDYISGSKRKVGIEKFYVLGSKR